MARRAVVFGSNGPESAGALHYAKSDALRMAAALKQPRCSFEVVEPRNSQNPQEIERCIAESAELCAGDDTFLVYFSGHGFIESAGLLLMLDRTDLNRPLTTALHADSIVRAMRFCPARHKMLILDCCHAGMVFSDSRFKSQPGAKMESFVGGSDKESESFVALMASDRLERAREFDRFEGSFLTKSICEAVGTSFADADQDRDGAIDLGDLKLWLTARARHHNELDSGARVPVPFVFGRERGRIYLTLEPADWRVHEIDGPNQHTFVVLPILAESKTAWLIGKTPVTNRQYRQFVEATGYREPVGEHFKGRGKTGRWRGPFRPWKKMEFSSPDQPVVCVDFEDANTYARWLRSFDRTLGITLTPTEVWDFAAFGVPHPSFDRRSWLTGQIHDNSRAPAAVIEAKQRANRFGAIDLFGNVWEWTLGGEMLEARIALLAGPSWEMRNQQLRGGSFLDDLGHVNPTLTAAAMRDGVRTKHSDLGFRLAAEIALTGLPADVSGRLTSAPRIRRERSRGHIARAA
jgi:hypothetical protein